MEAARRREGVTSNERAYRIRLLVVMDACRLWIVEIQRRNIRLLRIRRTATCGRVGLNPITKLPLSPLNTAPMQHGPDLRGGVRLEGLRLHLLVGNGAEKTRRTTQMVSQTPNAMDQGRQLFLGSSSDRSQAALVTSTIMMDAVGGTSRSTRVRVPEAKCAACAMPAGAEPQQFSNRGKV